jgi:hypothetical protein
MSLKNPARNAAAGFFIAGALLKSGMRSDGIT